jgi:hypothetical protein
MMAIIVPFLAVMAVIVLSLAVFRESGRGHRYGKHRHGH